MELIDIYNSIKNPLDEPSVIDTIIEKYGESSNKSFHSCITKVSKKENVGRVYPHDRDIFYSKMFNVWKSNVLKMTKEEFLELKKAGIYDDRFIKVRELLKTVPDVQTYDEERHIITQNYNDRELNDALEDYSWCSDGLMSPWEFIKSHRIAAYRSKKMKIEHRLYLNVDPLDIYKVSIALIKKCISRNIPFDFKFDRIGNRDDTLIIYTDTEHLVDFISILNEIKQDHPDIVGRFKNPPILTGDIGGWIGYGSEPATRGTSFNEVRAKAIEKAMDEAVTKWIEDHFIRLLTYNNNTIHVYEYVTAIITEDIMKQLTSSYTWKVENEEKNAASKKEAPNYKKIYEDLGYTGNDLKNIKFKNYIYQHLLASLKNNLVDFLKAKKSETVITIPLKNGKAYQVTANKIQSATKRIVPTINKKDPDFKNQVKEAIKTKLDEVGVDINNIAFDKYIVEKFKTTSMPNIHKPKFKESTTVEPVNIKPQKVVAIESQRVIQAKESPLVHTTYVPSHRLIDELNSLLDYNSDKVIEFLYNNMIAIRLLLPIVIRKNKEIADEFYDANIKAHPELQNIYEQSLKGRLGGY